jgi:hypothetical protein
MANGISFKFDDGNLFRNIAALETKISGAVDILVDYHALRGMQHLKTDAPWTDRTGAARTGLHTVSFSGGNKHTIVFAHAVHYGIWLEVKFSGRDEVIMPTVRKTGRELMQSLNGLMNRI